MLSVQPLQQPEALALRERGVLGIWHKCFWHFRDWDIRRYWLWRRYLGYIWNWCFWSDKCWDLRHFYFRDWWIWCERIRKYFGYIWNWCLWSDKYWDLRHLYFRDWWIWCEHIRNWGLWNRWWVRPSKRI
ncbi:hypothetical protein L0F63_004347 [Massospora cicadina]|nr:hypothetical protein L0F63_004347 [Massospora cicadina]